MTKPRRFSLQWFAQKATWLLITVAFFFAVSVPGSLIGPVS